MAIEIGIPTSVSDIVQAIKDESIEPSELHTDEIGGAGRPYSTADDWSDVSIFWQEKILVR